MKTEYHKIQSLFERDLTAPGKPLNIGDFTCPEFEFLKDAVWEFTEKVDGTNIRIEVDPTGYSVFKGREENSQIPANLVQVLRETFDPLKDRLAAHFPDGAVLYGEGYGGLIQKVGPLYHRTPKFVLFDVRVGPWWLQRSDVVDVASHLELDVVPVIGEGTIDDLIDLVSNGFKSIWNSNLDAEGIVARPKVELCTRGGDRIITKLKHRDFPRS